MNSDESRNLPIGVFDSGIGGLTVVAEISRKLPHEKVIYFGDTGRFPYGVRSKEVVKNFSRQNVNFLLGKKVKFVVVACNSASAVALSYLRRNFEVPMMGVIEPGAKAAVRATRNGRIGIIGTEATIASGSYPKAIKRISGAIKVFGKACPLFVSLAQEGYINREATRLIADDYLKFFKTRRVDTLVLGCTHYPLLKPVISQIMGEAVSLIDSAEETALEVREVLTKRKLLRPKSGKVAYRYFVSDTPEKFVIVGERFLRRKIPKARRVDIGTY
jgi:glutamate racemase